LGSTSFNDQIYGGVYAISTILAPENKLHFFSSNDWEEKHRKQHRESFENSFRFYKHRLSDIETSSQPQPSTVADTEINRLLKGKKRHRQANETS
jgi:hypothetical protein